MQEISLFEKGKDGNSFSEICTSIHCNPCVPGWPDRFGRAIQGFLASCHSPKIRTLSLFSGAGGLDIGFADAGFDIIASVEVEDKFCATLRLNSGAGKQFPAAHVNCIDIREFKPDGLGKIDFIIGGPPCQTFSAAGRRANGVLGTSDSRGVLFKEYVRLLKEIQPQGFLFENVYGIIGAQQGKPWQEILKSFSAAGYHLFYRILDAADYGVPQHRERLIIVGLRTGSFCFPRPTHGPDSLDHQGFYTAREAIEGLFLTAEEAKSGIGGRYGNLLDAIPPGLNYSFYTEQMGHPHPVFAWRSKFSDFLYKADPDEPVRTIKASGGAYTGPFHWENRSFSYAEYKRLQTFPDDYEISGARQTAVKQIGNSVPPQLARILAIAIRQQVFGTTFPFAFSLLAEAEVLGFRKRKRALTKIYQQKAKAAIAALSDIATIEPRSHQYYCTMTDRFDFREVPRPEAAYKIQASWQGDLEIRVSSVSPAGQLPGAAQETVIIDIDVDERTLKQQLNHCRIRIFAQEPLAFTVGWKAFEQELIRNHLKADLVQLNGYYQYEPLLKCRVRFLAPFPKSSILARIVGGELVATLVSSQELAEAWGIDASQIFDVAGFLRRLGYEIRNHHTNPQIERDNWLIPYAFPTLTNLSVQLRKKLRG